ncbi:MAG: U32 family peptidase [Lachnospiraceae bacterium]|nr:U32 family peptidase [uncultured Acetatifactor sp.]MCI9221307.1 U32 family peptidase [Lachnospiraceae bacterium]
MEKCHKVELLAPAGNAAGFYGAVHAGADAVYLAGNRFGARAYAENFTSEELLECIRYGHLLGRKIYLTVNTLLKNQEMEQLYTYLAPLYQAGLDAVIVQDLGVLRFIRTHFPGLKLHVSTQMTICAPWGASLLKEMGASRIVPARELSLEELIAMSRQSDIEVETFIHGAMCYCYSGQCLFSSILGGRSGNRGRCAQPCRLPYSVISDGTDRRECLSERMESYPLSLKDMCTVDHIPQLIEAGIDSFKIEGRMKRPEYAAGVTDIYRRCIDYYYTLRRTMDSQEAAKAYHVKKEDRRALASLYVRSGLHNGYYFKRNGRDMVTLDSPAYSESDEKLLARIQEKHMASRLKLPVTVQAFFHVGSPAKVILKWNEISADVRADTVERAMRQPVTEENVRKQLCKLGDSAFYEAKTEISMDPDCFYPLKQINELRRMAVAKLERQILLARGADEVAAERPSDPYNEATGDSAVRSPHSSCGKLSMEADGLTRSGQKHKYAFYVRTKEQLEALGDWTRENPLEFPARIYVDGDLLLTNRSEVLSFCRKSFSGSDALYAALPYILRETDRDYLLRLHQAVKDSGLFQGFLVRSMDGLGFLREAKAQSGDGAMSWRTDAGVYAWNDSALEELAALAEGFCLPYELNAAGQRCLLEGLEQKDLRQSFSCEKIIYSRIPMMITANCLRKTMGECGKGPEILLLQDRIRKDFPVLTNCLHCMNILYNSVPFSLHGKEEQPGAWAGWKGRVDLRMDFTLETPRELRQVLDAFFKGTAFPWKDYTTAHEKRGAE